MHSSQNRPHAARHWDRNEQLWFRYYSGAVSWCHRYGLEGVRVLDDYVLHIAWIERDVP